MIISATNVMRQIMLVTYKLVNYNNNSYINHLIFINKRSIIQFMCCKSLKYQIDCLLILYKKNLNLNLQSIQNIYFMNISVVLVIFALVMLSASAMNLRSHEGLYAWYTFNEGPTRNKCKNAKQCDGQRSCSAQGYCTGTSRPVKNADYIYDEAFTLKKCPSSPSYPNYANRDYYCDGNRTCSGAGLCQGTSR